MSEEKKKEDYKSKKEEENREKKVKKNSKKDYGGKSSLRNSRKEVNKKGKKKKKGNKIERDPLFVGILSLAGLGLGHLFMGITSKGLTILIVQISLILLAGVAMVFIPFGAQIMYVLFFLILIWSVYDALMISLNKK